MKNGLRALIFGLLLANMGCSNQWREVDADFDSSEMNDIFTSAMSESTDSVSSQVNAMYSDPSTVKYFATAPGALGPVVSIASLYSFAWLGADEANMNYWDIDEVSVLLLDQITSSGHQVGFVFRYRLAGNTTYVTHMFLGTGNISGDKYRAVLTNNGQAVLAIESNDIESSDLADVIKLKAYDYDASGNEMDDGQFSTLVHMN